MLFNFQEVNIMGWASEMQIKEQERGYGHSDKIVCYDCVGDYYLKQYIKDHGELDTCDYCGANEICITLEELMEPIMNGVFQEYEDANGSVGWEGGFVGAETYDSYDLIHEEIFDELQFESDDLLDDVSNLISDAIVWCQRDPYGQLPYDEDFYTWEEYVNVLKNQGADFEKYPDSELRIYKKPDDILSRISEGINMLGLIETLPTNTPLWRSRAHKESEIVNSAAELGSPKENKAGCNRMTEAGVSTFYGAFDKQIALKETAGQKDLLRTVGVFYNQAPLDIINFNKLNSIGIPSLFDIENSGQRMLLIFLNRFNQEISKSVASGKQKEYLPTQKVIEYLKNKITSTDGSKIKGVIYNCSKKSNKFCCALFIDWRQCSNEKDSTLWLDRTSLETSLAITPHTPANTPANAAVSARNA